MNDKTHAVQRMQDYIERHLSESITLAELARAARFSPWYSARIFKELTGLSPADYIRRLRLAVLRIDWLSCAANLVFGAALWAALGGATNVLHPDSPIFGGDSARIQWFFIVLLVLSLSAGAVFTLLARRKPQA